MIELIDVKKQFDNQWVSKGITLSIPEGKMTCIIGRSGEGKSVLLKQIGGLIRPTSGQIIMDGVDIVQLDEMQLHEVHEKCGYVFQFAALLDSLTIFENIGITLLEQGIEESEVMHLVKEKLALVHLSESILYKYPSEISGGMRKRVGLARTLMLNPKIILYDEPTTGLDPITTRIVHELMYDMQKKLQLTSIVISHDPEIFKFADVVALLHDGVIKYVGDARIIWDCDNHYVYQFIRGLSTGPFTTRSSVAI